VAKRGVGGLTVGSETAAGVKNVYMHDVVIEDSKYGIYFKTRRPRGGGGEKMWFERIHVKSSERPAIFFDMLGSPNSVGGLGQRLPEREVNRLTPAFRDITFRDITIDNCPTMLRAKGLPERPIENLTFENINSANREISVQDIGTMIIK
jgi:polygalacturonase